MATKIKLVTVTDFIEVTPEGKIDLATSRQLLVDIAKAEVPPVDYDLLIDFRQTQWQLSITDLYQLASELINHGDTFRRKIAILVLPEIDFQPAAFLETCSQNRGFQMNAFRDYETALRWLLSS